ncbi:MAG TPA: GDSL-type esterase/lipase family protein [Tepidisphaeraceae bacterium]
MKLRSLLAILLLCLCVSRARAGADQKPSELQEGDHVAVIGDSITEQRLYSMFIEDYLLMYRPASRLTMTQFGWGGDTATGFAARMANDMLRFKPQVATINYGMNDGGYSPMDDAKAKEKYGPKYNLCGGDGVHPDRNGHLVMAYAYLKALGCSGDIGTITVDLKNGKAEATDGHKILSAKDGSVEVESSKYPFCFFGEPALTGSTRGVLEFLPFNEDLNRFKLIVTGATAEKLTVTWGKESKTFPAADLAKGINLAAEFLDNPFCVPFQHLEQRISQQQNNEVILIKFLMHNLPEYLKHVPDEKDSIEHIANKLLQDDKTDRHAAAAAVKPVTHTIKIEPAKAAK